MRGQAIILFSMACCVSACTRLPALPSRENVEVGHIVNRIKCEVQDAASYIQAYQPSNWKRLESWVAGFTLKLVVEDQIGFSPSIVVANLPLNILSPHLFSVTPAFSVAGTSRRTVSVTFGFAMNRIDDFVCTELLVAGRPLTSNLGLYEWLERSLAPFNDDGIAVPSHVGSVLDFIIDGSGRVTPGLALVRANPGSISGSALLSGSRKDTHTLEVGFKPI
jgi:hypothetical protein